MALHHPLLVDVTSYFYTFNLSKFWMITGGTVLLLYQSLWPKTAAYALPMRKSLPLVLSTDTQYVTVFFLLSSFAPCHYIYLK